MLITTRFPKCIENINPWIEKALKSSRRIQREQAQSKHILLRLLKIREDNLKSSQMKNILCRDFFK